MEEPLEPASTEATSGTHLQLRGVLFLALISQTSGMNAEQANDLLTRIMDLS